MNTQAVTKCGDARGLPSDALERLRRSAVAAVESGVSQTQVAVGFGVSRKTVGGWVRAYRARGEDSFRPAKRGRRAGDQVALSAADQERIVSVLVAGPPDRFGLPCRLWTRRAVGDLVHRDVGVGLGSATIGRYLRLWGIDPLADPGDQVCTKVEPPGAVLPAAPAEDVHVTWTRLCVPIAADPAHAVLAVTTRGVLHFLARDRPFDLAALEDLRRRLRMQLGRDVRIVARDWPLEHSDLLDRWLSGVRT